MKFRKNVGFFSILSAYTVQNCVRSKNANSLILKMTAILLTSFFCPFGDTLNVSVMKIKSNQICYEKQIPFHA